jgi:hypothetical protein
VKCQGIRTHVDCIFVICKVEPSKTKRDSIAASAFNNGYVVISGDYDGDIKVFVNAPRPKHSSLPSPTVST